MNKTLYYLALAMTMGLAACSSDDNATDVKPTDPADKIVNLQPAQATVMAFTSNDQKIDASAQVNENTSGNFDRTAEINTCKAKMQDGNSNTDVTKDFVYEGGQNLTLYFYPLEQKEKGTTIDLFYYDEAGKYYTIGVYNNLQDSQMTAGKGQKGKQITLTNVKTFGFYWEDKDSKGQNTTYYYTSSKSNPTGSSNLAGTFTANGKTYLGISKDGKGDFTDAMFMFTTALKTTTETEVTPDPIPDPTPDPTPDPIVTANNGSVEVNFAMNAEHEQGDWKDSHLSIHVRDTTDITFYIPIKAEYYCPQDDMQIVQKHDAAYQYNETNETMSMNINGTDVSLNVTFDTNGITIKSEGINADVLKYLRTTYGDGLTFEIHNYYNDGLNRTQLQQLLNQSTISFSNATKTYINAFGRYKNVDDPLACRVKPTDETNRTTPPAEGVISEDEQSLLYIYPLK